MNILVRGEQPVPAASAASTSSPTRPATSSCSRTTTTRPNRTPRRRGRIYAEVVEKATDQRPEATDLAEMDAYGMAATIELEPALKQKLLDSRSEDERLDIVEELFEKAVERLERAEHVSEVARSNGKVRF